MTTTLSPADDADTSQQLTYGREAESVQKRKQFVVGPGFPTSSGKNITDDANSQSKHRTCKARMEKARASERPGGHQRVEEYYCHLWNDTHGSANKQRYYLADKSVF